MQLVRPFILSLLVTSLSLATLGLAQAETPKSLPQRNPFLPYNTISSANPAQSQLASTFQGIPMQEDIFWHTKLNYLKAAEIKEALQNICISGKISAEALSNTIIFTNFLFFIIIIKLEYFTESFGFM